MDVNTYNVCRWCDKAWSHRPDCMWLRLHVFVTSQGVELEPIEEGTLPK